MLTAALCLACLLCGAALPRISLAQGISNYSITSNGSLSSSNGSLSVSPSPATGNGSLSVSPSPATGNGSLSVSPSPATGNGSLSVSPSPATGNGSLSISPSPATANGTYTITKGPSLSKEGMSAGDKAALGVCITLVVWGAIVAAVVIRRRRYKVCTWKLQDINIRLAYRSLIKDQEDESQLIITEDL